MIGPMPSKRVGQLSGLGDILHRRRLFYGLEIQDGVLVLLPLRKTFQHFSSYLTCLAASLRPALYTL